MTFYKFSVTGTMRKLENNVLKVQIDDLGAELCSVLDKETGVERIHDADPGIWNRHAPFLFPFVGKVIGGIYRIDNKEYKMDLQHGFARDIEMVCLEEGDGKVVHKLVSTEETKEIYPYDFELMITHELDKKNPRKLIIRWDIINTGEGKMNFFIGAHPGFTLPINKPEEKEEYYLGYGGKDKITYFGVHEESGFATPDITKTVQLQDGCMKFNDDIYITLIFDYPDFETVSINRPDKTPYITMECKDFTNFGIWTKEEASYICLEPWYGRTDDHGFNGDITEKIGVQTLEAGEKRSIAHTIEFHK